MKTIIIIGGGLGGLTAGALLAKQGHKVTLLEQHMVVGGSATTFKRRGGFTVEVGLHEMENPFDKGPKEQIFKALGVYDNVEFIKPDEFFRVKTGKSDFIMPDGIEAAIKALTEKFPNDREGIKKYFGLLKAIGDDFERLQQIRWWQKMLFPFIFTTLLKYRKSSVTEVLDGLIKDKELKLILNANIQYYHDTPDELSFLFHAVAQYGYYAGGGWYIKGGSQVLSDYLASVITDNGGTVIKKAYATTILHDSKKANGVTYERKHETFGLKADVIISNLSPSLSYKLANIPYDEEKRRGISLLSMYIGFSKDIKAVYGKRAYSNFYLRGADSLSAYEQVQRGPVNDRTAVFVDYSQIDSALTPEGKSLGVVCGVDYLSDWESLSKEQYKAKKESVRESYTRLLEEEYPGISELIEYAEVGTAKTVKHYLKTPEGTPYGFAPTARQFFRQPQIKSDRLSGLYFVGAWVIGGGFTPAILSGGMAAKEIESP